MSLAKIRFKSEVLNLQVPVQVYLPENGEPAGVVYLLHERGGDENSWILHSRVLDYAGACGLALVMPAGLDRYFVDNVHGKAFYQFLTGELREKTECWFSVNREASRRFIAGADMGGYGAFYAALNSPGLYKGAYSLSGILDIEAHRKEDHTGRLFPVFGSDEEFMQGHFALPEGWMHIPDDAQAAVWYRQDTKFTALGRENTGSWALWNTYISDVFQDIVSGGGIWQ